MSLDLLIGILAVAGLVVGLVIAWALGAFERRSRSGAPLPRCARCKQRHGTTKRPAHSTVGDVFNGHLVSWIVLCEECFSVLSRQSRYEFYALQAREWGMQNSPEWQAVKAAVMQGL